MFLNVNLIDLMINNGFYFETTQFNNCLSSSKGYASINHAYKLLNNTDEYSLIDAISNLRRAVNFRISDIYKNLGINSLKMTTFKNKEKLEVLEYLGIVKPLLIKKLLSIRNDIDYRGSNPPPQSESLELADVVWYFYKSTDRYCNIQPNSLLTEWEENEVEYWINLEFDFFTHKKIEFRSRLPQGYIADKREYEYSIFMKGVEIKDYSESDLKYNIQSGHISYCVELDTSLIPYYTELFSLVLSEWGN